MKRLAFLMALLCLAWMGCEKTVEDQLEEDIATIDKYIEDNNIDALRDPSGVWIQTLEEGEGETLETFDEVGMYYQMTDLDENILVPFQTSRTELCYGSLVPGWQTGMSYMKPGGMAKIYIPSTLGYGQFGIGGNIPGDTNLIIETNLVSVSPNSGNCR
ncbi:MAG: FKBP-type peptidyl-prolyl cis-trans isomerase [Bacteroidota bacterium]